MPLAHRNPDNSVVILRSRDVGGGVLAVGHDVLTLPGTVETDITAIKAAADELAAAINSGRMAVDLTTAVTNAITAIGGAISSGRMQVDLATAVNTYLSTLAGAISSGRMQVDLAATPTGNLAAIAAAIATIAGAIASARMQVDLATTPTANLATLAGAIASARMQVDLATTPTANLATLAAAIASARMQVDLATTPTANLATLAGAIAAAKMQAEIVSALPAGTNAIGKLAANSGVVIGDVNVATVTQPTSIFNGKTTVTTAGTRVVLGTSQALKSGALIKALRGNTGLIYVGDSTVASTNGLQLAAGEVCFVPVADRNTVNLDSSVNGEGVTYLAS